MMQAQVNWRSRWREGYFYSLFFLIVFLPSLEVPKNIALLSTCALGIAYLISMARDARNRRFDADDVLLTIWMVSGYVVALFAAIHHLEWRGASGPLTLALLLLVLKNVPLEGRQTHILLLAALVSTLLANIEGLLQVWLGQRPALQLHSVGHVNHSAIYLGLNFVLALAMTLGIRRNEHGAKKLLVLLCLLVTVASIVVARSRATVLATMIVGATMIFILRPRARLFVPLLIAILLATGGALYFSGAAVVHKQLEKTSFLGERAALWNSALLAWRHAPAFGLGIKNYGEATLDRQKQWLQEEGKPFVAEQYAAYPHAHSLYLNTLVEQGIFGLALTLLVLGRITWLLCRFFPRRSDSEVYWITWCSAFGALQIVLINGLFNTTLHHEHGIFTVLLIGLWWNTLKNREVSHG